MELALQVFNVAMPVLLCSLAGYFWSRLRMPFDSGMVTPLLMYLAVPCLLLARFSEMQAPPGAVLRLLVATLLAHVCFGGLGWVFLRACGVNVRHYLSSMIFGNNGNLGLPLCMLAYGAEGLYLGLGYMVVSIVGLFTVGVWINSGRATPVSLLKTPVLYAALAAVAMAFSGLRLPAVFRESLSILGNLAIPLMLLALGVSLAGLTVRNLRLSLLLSFFKTGMGVLVGVALAWLLDLRGVARDVFLLQNIMPVAVFNFLLAKHCNGEAGKVAGLVMVSSLCGLVAIPVALALLLE